ncbi:MAG: glycosyltransferase [Flavobacteriaceae bacterium]|nr:glycosyltransferase [Flavobacteriaceae bacterium]
MSQAIVITPVKDSLVSTLETIKAIKSNHINVEYFVYNDFSTLETKIALEENTKSLNFQLINLEDIANTPSPNYKLVLQLAQKKALERNLPLIIVESDVTIQPDTFTKMIQFNSEHNSVGMIGAITVDTSGKVNFPYLKFKNKKKAVIETHRSLSFCCTLLTVDFLEEFNFTDLEQSKDWYDTIISKKAIELGFKNYVLMNTPVLHKPHSSRPWKHLKYKNPIKYYWLKLINRRDKI